MSGISTNCPAPDAKRRVPWFAVSRTLCRWLVAAVFLAAAISKVIDLTDFSNRVVLHSGLPYMPALIVAAVLPWLELTCGLCLALGVATREAAVLVALMLVAFLVYSLFHLHEDNCQCFLFPSALAPLNQGWWPLARNLLLLLVCLPVIWRANGRR
jgi:putative oxidoreductase